MTNLRSRAFRILRKLQEADFDQDDMSLLQRRISGKSEFGHRVKVGRYDVLIMLANHTFMVYGTKYGQPDSLLYSGWLSSGNQIRWDFDQNLGHQGPPEVEKVVLDYFKAMHEKVQSE